jgi:hypothetical protein
MNLRRTPGPAVQVPSPADDRPAWIKIGLIALAGFVIGVAWPRLAGIHLGPAAPLSSPQGGNPEGTPSSTASGQPARAEAPPQATMATVSPPPSPSAPAAEPAAAPPVEVPSVTVNRGVVLSCKSEDGDVKKGVGGCGAVPGFDAIAQPRLRKLAQCPAAIGASGKLSVVFNIDFPQNRVAVEIGKSSTVANMDAFASCVKPVFQGVSLGALDHQNPHYALFYSLVFSPKAASAVAAATPPAAGAGAATPAAAQTSSPVVPDSDESTAQVIWEVAIVRDTPRTGQVLARLQRGTKIHLGSGQDGWYRVKYGSDFASEGWVYRGAIGR